MKKFILILSVSLTVFIIGYTAYEARTYAVAVDTMADFFDVYINNVQKYTFNGSIYYLPILYATSLDYMTCEYRVRIGNCRKLYGNILANTAISAAGTAAGVILLNVMASLWCGCGKTAAKAIPETFERLVIVYIQSGLTFNAVYAMSQKKPVACVAVATVNLLISVLIYGIDFLLQNRIQTIITAIFMTSECVMAAVMFAVSYCLITKGELLR
ncbi:MAG: hypothetical protein ACI4EU_10920 [Butyrivibrio sp.]